MLLALMDAGQGGYCLARGNIHACQLLLVIGHFHISSTAGAGTNRKRQSISPMMTKQISPFPSAGRSASGLHSYELQAAKEKKSIFKLEVEALFSSFVSAEGLCFLNIK